VVHLYQCMINSIKSHQHRMRITQVKSVVLNTLFLSEISEVERL